MRVSTSDLLIKAFYSSIGSLSRYPMLCGLIVFLVVFPLSTTLLATEDLKPRLAMERYSIEDGLSNNFVSAIYQDSRGFLWFGTQDGLNRFDGYNFRIYRNEHSNNKTLIDAYVINIFEDKANTLWVTTWKGLHRYWPLTDSFERIEPGQENGLEGEVLDFYQERPDLMWFATTAGLYKYEPAKHYFTRTFAMVPGRNEPAVVNAIAKGNGDYLWLATNVGLYRFNKKTEQHLRFGQGSRLVSALPESKILYLLKGAGNTLWLGTHQGVFMFNTKNESFQWFSEAGMGDARLSDDLVMNMALDDKGDVWVGTVNGLNRIDVESGIVEQHYSSVRDPDGLSKNTIFSLFVDGTGHLWIGTYGNGINRWNPASIRFKHYLNKADVPGESGNNFVNSLVVDQRNRLWIATDTEGIFLVDRYLQTITNYKHSAEDEYSLCSNDVSTLHEDYMGILWVGTLNHIVCRFEEKTQRFIRYELPRLKTGSMGFRTYVIYEDHLGKLWVGASASLYQYDREQDNFHTVPVRQPAIKAKNTQDQDFHIKSTMQIYHDLDGYYWFTGFTANYRVNPAFDSYITIGIRDGDAIRLRGADINALFEDYRGNMWIATNSGLEKLTWLSTGRYQLSYFDNSTGLSKDSISSMLPSPTANNELWIATGTGLERFNIGKGSSTQFSRKDGLHNLVFYLGAAASTQENELIFGGSNGVTAFYPEQIKVEKRAARLVMISYQEMGKEKHYVPSTRQDYAITINEDNTFLNLEFALLDYSEPKSNTFKYRIIGVNDQWIDSGNKNVISLSNLAKGHYQLEVAAAGPRKVWSKNLFKVYIDVNTPFYQSYFATAGYIIAAIAAILSLFYQQRKHFLSRFSQLEKNMMLERQDLIGTREAKKALESGKEKLQQELEQTENTLRMVKKKYNDMQMLDPVTGVRTKKFVVSAIENDINQVSAIWSNRTLKQKKHLSIMFVDIDGFHFVNEKYGYLAANNVLTQFATVLRSVCQGSDTLAKWSSKQFLIVSYVSHPEELVRLSEKIRNLVAARPYDLGNGGKTDLTCSIGFTLHPFSEAHCDLFTWEQLLDVAEQALFACKKTGRNAWIGLRGGDIKDPNTLRNDIDRNIKQYIDLREVLVLSSIAELDSIQWGFGYTDSTIQKVEG